MYYFRIEATPKPTNQAPETVGAGGAYVNCWVNFPLEDGAELLARHYIEKADWEVGKVHAHKWVEREQYEDYPDRLAYIVEAEQDGISLVFYCWPEGVEETDVEYSAASKAAHPYAAPDVGD